MNKEKRAWCDAPNHVIVYLGQLEHGIDLAIAENLASDLITAIDQAKQTPFERWWDAQTPPTCNYDPKRWRLLNGMPFARDWAEKMFNEIRNAK